MFKGTRPPGRFQAVNTAPHHGPPVFIMEGETSIMEGLTVQEIDTEKKLPKVKKTKKLALPQFARMGWMAGLPRHRPC